MTNGKLITKLKHSEIVAKVCLDFTYEFQDTYTFDKHQIDKSVLPKDFNIGLIVGTSGSGKSLLLKEFGYETQTMWSDDDAVCSHFSTYEEATKKLMGAGFNSIPQWLVPYTILSTGQKYRDDLARTIDSDRIYDEFTSVIDRGTALGLSNSIQKLIRDENYTNVVFASVHKDIIPYLQPDWIYNTDDKTLTINSETFNISNLEKIEYTKKKPFMLIK